MSAAAPAGGAHPPTPVAHSTPPLNDMASGPPGAKVTPPGSVKAHEAPPVNANGDAGGVGGPPGILKKKPSRPENREGRVQGPPAPPVAPGNAPHAAPHVEPHPIHELSNVPDGSTFANDAAVAPIPSSTHPGGTSIVAAPPATAPPGKSGSIKASKPASLATIPATVKPAQPLPPAGDSGVSAHAPLQDATHHDGTHDAMPEHAHDAGHVVKPPPGKLRKPSRANSLHGQAPVGDADPSGHTHGPAQSLHSMGNMNPDAGGHDQKPPLGPPGKGSPASSLKNVGAVPAVPADIDAAAAERERAQSECDWRLRYRL